MHAPALRPWRDARRAELLRARIAMPLDQRRERQRMITRLLVEGFAGLRGMIIGGYWPFNAEFDPRPAMRHFRRCGARLALPAVVQKNAPLAFFEWWPGAPLRPGVLGLPVPEGTERLTPQALLIPLLGFDAKGLRLGWGGGYFDRILAAMDPQPLKIGVGFELSRMGTIRPQPHDVPMDFIVTEAGLQRVGDDGLVHVGEMLEDVRSPQSCERHRYASPVCYAPEFEAEAD